MVYTSKKRGGYAYFASGYFENGFSALPVKPGTKATNINKWTDFCAVLPSKEVREEWISKFGAYGLAVALGKPLANGNLFGAVDVDDQRLVRLAQTLTRPSQCTKKGKKGLTLFVQFGPNIKSSTIYLGGKGGSQAVDILADGRMTVLPPTIHPDTQQPYEWIGDTLLDVPLESLPVWEEQDLRLFKQLCEMPEIIQVLAGSGTHEATLKLCQRMFGFELSDEKIAALIKSILPKDYEGNTLQELPQMIEWGREHHKRDLPGGPPKSKENTIVEKLIQWGRGQQLYTDDLGRSFISITNTIRDDKNESV